MIRCKPTSITDPIATCRLSRPANQTISFAYELRVTVTVNSIDVSTCRAFAASLTGLVKSPNYLIECTLTVIVSPQLGYLIGSTFGVSAVTAAAGVQIALWLVSAYTLTKNAAEAWTVGQLGLTPTRRRLPPIKHLLPHSTLAR
jgi:hypothetical protein